MAALELSEEEYNREIGAYLAGGGSQPLADHLMRAVHSRLELMIHLTER